MIHLKTKTLEDGWARMTVLKRNREVIRIEYQPGWFRSTMLACLVTWANYVLEWIWAGGCDGPRGLVIEVVREDDRSILLLDNEDAVISKVAVVDNEMRIAKGDYVWCDLVKCKAFWTGKNDEVDTQLEIVNAS